MVSSGIALLLGLFFSFIGLVLLSVILTYSTCWYEYANGNPQLLQDRFKPRNLIRALSLILQETCFNTLTLILIPFGISKPRRRLEVRGETPTLLMHGLFCNRACWLRVRLFLRNQGFRNVTTINLSLWHNEEALTELVAKKIDELRHQLGVNKVNIVGHSMGGIIARNYIQLRGGSSKVERCVTLGSPHHGTKLAPLSAAKLGLVLMPGSDFLRRLNTAPPPEGVKFTCIYSKKDNMVVPNNNSRLDWAENIELDNIGHTGLIYRSAALRALAKALRNSEIQ